MLTEQGLPDGQWWASRWRYLLRGLDLEVSGTETGLRVKRLEVTPGRISADVKDGREAKARECVVEVRVQTWQDGEWQRATDALSRQALYAARLLAGNLPPELERGLAEAGLALLPQRRSDLAAVCSCCGGAITACPHVRAVFAALGDLLAESLAAVPVAGARPSASVGRAAQASGAHVGEHTVASGARGAGGGEHGSRVLPGGGGGNGVADAAPSLEAEMHAFWGKAKAQESFHAQVVRPVVELALLRRLGTPEFAGSTGELFDALAEVYRRVTEEGIAVAYAADPGWPVSEGEELA